MGRNLRKLWRKVRDWILEQIDGGGDPAPAPSPDPAPTPAPESVPDWRKCVRSTNWDGNNASRRYMNMLSPKFPDSKFDSYLKALQSAGVDHVHLLLMNAGDGEGAGYDCILDKKCHELALARIRKFRSLGLGVVLWLVADDSKDYRMALVGNPSKYASAAKDLLEYASYCVLGLEMDENKMTLKQWRGVRDAVRKVYSRPLATHHTSGRSDFSSLGEIYMDQLDPSCTASKIKSRVKSLVANGWNVCGFEYSRKPARSKAQAALDGGAFGCGNW